MKFRSKRYRLCDQTSITGGPFELGEAVNRLKAFPSARFDETVDLAVNVGIDPKQTEQQVRGSFSLPNGVGKEKRVVAFAEGKKAEEARAAGAIEVGSTDLVEKILGGWTDFDVAVATPDMMRHVGKLGRVLGPQGKMPAPKSGTVTSDVGTVVAEFKAGKVEFRVDKGATVHVAVGKKSFEAPKLVANVQAMLEHLKTMRPATAKGAFLRSASISATMSPAIKIAVSE